MSKKAVVAALAGVLAAAALASGGERTFDKKALQAAGEGRAVYLAHCVGCHGVEAHGGLTGTNHTAAPDLTLIAVRDGGFDARHVGMHIDGRKMDSQGEMPCWGQFFTGSRSGKEGWAATRIYVLTRYLDFIQAPEGAPPGER